MSEYKFHPVFERASITDYVALFRSVYGDGEGKLTAEYLQWQYVENPAGRVVGFDAFRDNQLAAHYIVIPRSYLLQGTPIRGALSANTATHPSHQGKGLFVKLAMLTYEDAATRGFKFVTGAANSNSIGGFVRKLGFRALGNIRLLVSLKGRFPRLDDLVLNTRDDAWLMWRLANPSRQYRYCEHADGTITLRTRVKGASFNLGRLGSTSIPLMAQVQKERVLVPSLTPYFASDLGASLRLPLQLQPSPWHVILRSLGSVELDQFVAQKIVFDGLSMDTF